MAHPDGDPVARWGLGSSVTPALLALVSFGVAVTTPPRTGPFAAPGSALTYPYSQAAQYVPRDFIWIYPALLMMLSFVVLAACVARAAGDERKLFGTMGLSFAAISFAVIAVDYLLQLQTVQPALLRSGEAAGVAVLSQYNPHGVFITLENLGFLVAAVSFAFLGLALGDSKMERAPRWVLLVAAGLAIVAFVGMSSYFGMGLEYRFEVSAITIDWLTLAVAGIMLAFVFRRSSEGPR